MKFYCKLVKVVAFSTVGFVGITFLVWLGRAADARDGSIALAALLLFILALIVWYIAVALMWPQGYE